MASGVQAVAEPRDAETGGLIPPHGGRLVDQTVPDRQRDEWERRFRRRAPRRLPSRYWRQLECLATGVYSPLAGFLGAEDYAAVVESLRLADGTVWPLPVVLPLAPLLAGGESAPPDDWLPVTGAGGGRGLVRVEAVYAIDPEREAALVYGTTSPEHPALGRLARRGRMLAAARVQLLEPAPHPFGQLLLAPRQVRDRLRALGWSRVAGFQTRNPMHRVHEYIQKCALEMADGLLCHPLVGETKDDDLPAALRVETYRQMLGAYFPADHVLLAVYPAPMHYAGPREALFHALTRQNYGCSHFIVGRDHAGVGGFYGTYAAQAIFDRFEPHEVAVVPLRFDHAFYCRRCGAMATAKTCPHGAQTRVVFSGSEVRRRLAAGEPLPPEITRPEVARLLAAWARGAYGPAGGGNGQPGAAAAVENGQHETARRAARKEGSGDGR